MSKTRKFWLVSVNVLTISRIIGAMFLFPIYFHYGAKTIATILLILFLTDWIDGYIARKYHVSTFFGSLADGISDKTLAIVSAIILCFINKYFIASVILEGLIFVVNLFVFTQKGNVKSSKMGKVKMWFISLSMVVGFYFSKTDTNMINLLIAIPAILSELFTLIDYIIKGSKVKIEISNKKPKYKKAKEIRKMLFNPEFYDKYKDQAGLINHMYQDE